MHVIQKTNYRIVIFIGGAQRALIRQFLKDPNTIVVVFDNRNEISRNRNFYKRHGVIYFELGPNSTSYELLEKAEAQVREAGHKTANFITNLGKGARVMLGFLAAKSRLNQADFLEFLDQLPDRIMMATGGRPESVQVMTIYSCAGATGGGAVSTIEETFAVALSAYGWAVESLIIILGPITFAGASRRSRQNGAATLVHLLAKYSNPTASENRIARAIYIAELPPLGKNQSRRDQLLHFDWQAWTAISLQFEHAIEHPNNAGTHLLGNFYSREIDIVGSLRQDTVAGQLAISLAREFDFGVPSNEVRPGLISKIFVDHTRDVLDRPTVSAIAADAEESTLERLLLLLEQPGYVNHLPLTVALFDRRHIDLTKFCHDLRQKSKTFSQECDDLALLRTLSVVLVEEIGKLDALIDEVQEIKTQTKNDLCRLLHKVQRSHFRRGRNMAALFQAMDDYRNIFDELQFLRELLDVTIDRKIEVDDASRIIDKNLDEVQTVLTRCFPSGEKPSESPLVISPSLDEAYPEILNIAEEHPDSWQALLAELALGVTGYGLARLADSPSTHYDQIARALLQKEAEVTGPALGAKERLDPATTYLVLPHTHTEVREAVSKAIVQSKADVNLHFTDGIRFGAAAVRFHFRQFATFRDILDGPILEELNQAYQDPARLLNFINGTSDIEAVGCQIVNGRIVFPDTPDPQSC